MNYTSIEQSMELLKLGLSPESSDMYYLRIVGETYNQDTDMVLPMTDTNSKIQLGLLTTAEYPTDDMLPAWSLGALLELMPKDIILERSGYKYNHRLYLTYNYEAEKWTVLYSNKIWDDIVFFGKTSTDAAYNMVVWLLENNYIKKESNH